MKAGQESVLVTFDLAYPNRLYDGQEELLGAASCGLYVFIGWHIERLAAALIRESNASRIRDGAGTHTREAAVDVEGIHMRVSVAVVEESSIVVC